MAQQFVKVVSLTQFTGANMADLPLQPLLGLAGPDSGHPVLANGTITITFPNNPGLDPIVIQTGEWLDRGGFRFAAADVAADYVPFGQVENPS